jgi:hypothetical protein
MYRGYGSKYSFWVGVVMLAVGLLVTIGSFALASFAGGGTYYVSFGLIILGIVRIVTALPAMLRGNKSRQQMPMGRMPTGASGYQMPYGAPPAIACWNCGRPVQGQSVCPQCGAPQYSGQPQAPMGPPGSMAQPQSWGQQPYPAAGQGYGQPGQYPPPGAAPTWGQQQWDQQQQPPSQGGW